MAATIKARAMATIVRDALAKQGVKRTVTDKTVRQWVRTHIDAYDDEGYTAHLYDARTQRTILDGMVGDAKGERAKSASAGRAKSAPKRKPAPTLTAAERAARLAAQGAPDA